MTPNQRCETQICYIDLGSTEECAWHSLELGFFSEKQTPNYLFHRGKAHLAKTFCLP